MKPLKLHWNSIKFLGFFLSDWLSFLNFRGTIKPGPFVLEKSRNTFSLPCSKSAAGSYPPFASPSKGSCILVPTALIRIFCTPNTPGSLERHGCCSQSSVPWHPKPSLQPSLPSFHQPFKSHLPRIVPYPPARNDLSSSFLLVCITCPGLNIWTKGQFVPIISPLCYARFHTSEPMADSC